MQATPDDTFLYITPIGYRKSLNCGYCRTPGSGHSYFARSSSMTPATYQTLIDRCWRRSGSLLYKTNQRDACCPPYTLRVDSSRFRAGRDQRQAVNRFNKYVIGDAYAKVAARLYPKSREQARKRDTEFDLVERIHESEARVLKQPPAPAHTFTVTLEPDDFTEEKYLLFANYQQVVHREAPYSTTRSEFRRFLCRSPLKQQQFTAPDGRQRQLGSFHQCYRLDGKLVAIGVLDLLPDCVSAVYFLYHESIHKFCPGKLGALQEIALAIEGGYRWWYPGFYIRTCPKMKYKMDFSPQQILNPDTLEWVDVTQDILSKFDNQGYLDFGKNGDGTEGATTLPEVRGNADRMSGVKDDESDEEASLFHSNMPGIPSLEDMSSLDLDRLFTRLNSECCYAVDLFDWHDESIRDKSTTKATVAELVAAVGPEFMDIICLDFDNPRRDSES
ncbi:arginine-tRNA-protein transferase [Durotheca rogersii]|uniref:arginine-tRNA-protein transferase n=1 Tax=Durotheca rogersii TaxID=419775 RepID=UPI00221F394D|nr:arginine-tRNA-protein transferase [Durotheca rogersii]KAI5863455.1 arginine-tRNA-protein transferase [Durotheca rogersii]